MRTSRIQPVVGGTYAKQFLRSNNGQLFSIMNNGRGFPFTKNPRQQQKNRKKSAEQARLSRFGMKHNTVKKAIGLPLDGESVEEMRKRLLEHQRNIQKARNREALIRTYRNSI